MTWAWWMTLAVILAVLLLIGCIPVGVDAAYGEGGIRLAVKIWLFRLQSPEAGPPPLPAPPAEAKKEKETAKETGKGTGKSRFAGKKAKSDPFRRRGRNFAAAGYCA